MCRNCKTTDQQPAASPEIIGQHTFGAIVGLQPVVGIRADEKGCAECDKLTRDYTERADDDDKDGCKPLVVWCEDCYSEAFAVCDECNKEVDREDSKDSDSGETYCESCYGRLYVKCNACDGEVGREDCRTSEGNDHYCDECYCENFTSCEHCGDELACNSGEEYYSEADSCVYCESCYSDRHARCAGRRCDTELSINSSDCHEHEGSYYCDDCYNENYRECDCCGEIVSTDNIGYCERFDADYCDDCHPGEECSNEECEDRGSCDCDAPTSRRSRSGSQPAASSTRETYWQNAKFAPVENSTVRTGTTRTFAVEVETASCPGHRDFNGRFAFNCESDGSIDGEEFPSAVLHGDAGLDAITAFCDEANSKNWTVDSKCGAHVHFGARDLSADQLKSIAYAYSLTSKAWGSFVSQKRRDNDYCLPLDWGFSEIAEIETLDDFMAFADKCEDNRYQWLNLASYAKRKNGSGPRKTIEIRLHSGSLDSVKINNWIVAHLRFIEGVMNMTMAEVERTFAGLDGYGQFRALSKVWDNAELSAYYSARAAKFGTNYTTSTRCSTRACKV